MRAAGETERTGGEMPKLFFEESRAFSDRVEQLFNFVHPASVALWNLRWKVQGFVDAVPDPLEVLDTPRQSAGWYDSQRS
jgi:hypothetical protein